MLRRRCIFSRSTGHLAVSRRGAATTAAVRSGAVTPSPRCSW